MVFLPLTMQLISTAPEARRVRGAQLSGKAVAGRIPPPAGAVQEAQGGAAEKIDKAERFSCRPLAPFADVGHTPPVRHVV